MCSLLTGTILKPLLVIDDMKGIVLPRGVNFLLKNKAKVGISFKNIPV
jgi:hypothetical protein